jgi:hypothetical protein
MKHKLAIFGLATIVTGSLSACGGSDGGGSTGMTAPPSMAQSLDTAQVLAQARQTSEVTYPYGVNSGLVVLTDTSDVTESYIIPGT